MVSIKSFTRFIRIASLVGVLLITVCTSLCAAKVTLKWLTYIAGTPTGSTGYTEVIAQFEKEHPDIRVEMIPCEWRNPDKFLLMIAAGGAGAPDIVWPVHQELGWYIAKDLLLDLTDFQKQAPIPLDEWFPVWMRSVTVGGRLYAIPFDVTIYSPFYNRDIFERSGMVTPSDNWTWEDYRMIAMKLTRKRADGTIEQLGSNLPAFTSWSGRGVLRSFGGYFVKPDGKDIGIDMPESIKAYQYLRDFISMVMGPAKVWMDPKSGKVGMWFDLGRPALMANTLNFDWGMLPWPKGPAGRFVYVDGTNWAIAKASKHPREAWEFIRFVTGEWAYRILAEKRGVMSARIPYIKYACAGIDSKTFEKVLIRQIQESGYIDTPTIWSLEAMIEVDKLLSPELFAFNKPVEQVVKETAEIVRARVISKYVGK